MGFRRGDFIPFPGVRKSLYSDHLLLVPIHYYYSTETAGIDNRFNLGSLYGQGREIVSYGKTWPEYDHRLGGLHDSVG